MAGWCSSGSARPQRGQPGAPRRRASDAYEELVAEGIRYISKQDHRRAAEACREAIALRGLHPRAAALCLLRR